MGLSGLPQRLAAQDRVHRAAEQIGNGLKVFRAGETVAPLPLRHGGWRETQLGAQLPLGHPPPLPQGGQGVHPGTLDPFGHFHISLPGFACLIAVSVLKWEKVLG